MHPALPTAKEKSWALETHAPGLGEHLHLQERAGSVPDHVLEV